MGTVGNEVTSLTYEWVIDGQNEKCMELYDIMQEFLWVQFALFLLLLDYTNNKKIVIKYIVILKLNSFATQNGTLKFTSVNLINYYYTKYVTKYKQNIKKTNTNPNCVLT